MSDASVTCYERDEARCQNPLCIRSGCVLKGLPCSTGSAEPAYKCLARIRAACAWPDCGCDPYATKVIAALVDNGWTAPQSGDAAQTEKVPVARPVAFRVPRVVDDKISKTEFRLFDDEEEARRSACDIGADYDGLYLVADRRAAFFAQPQPGGIAYAPIRLPEWRDHAEKLDEVICNGRSQYALALACIIEILENVEKALAVPSTHQQDAAK